MQLSVSRDAQQGGPKWSSFYPHPALIPSPRPLSPSPFSDYDTIMERNEIENLITNFLGGSLSIAGLVSQLTAHQTADLTHTQLDLGRANRCGFPEVIYGPGKTPPQLIDIIQRLLDNNVEAFATRVSIEQAHAVTERFPIARHNNVGRTIRVQPAKNVSATKRGRVTIITAGTTDLPVAEEARETADWMGCETNLIADIGVAGPQRLLGRVDEIRNSDAIVVVAGMEGALPSVVGGHVDCPIIAVPTSVGYGAAFGGIAPLLGMLNSCAANVTVVNIDAGFKAGYVAGMIARQSKGERGKGNTNFH